MCNKTALRSSVSFYTHIGQCSLRNGITWRYLTFLYGSWSPRLCCLPNLKWIFAFYPSQLWVAHITRHRNCRPAFHPAGSLAHCFAHMLIHPCYFICCRFRGETTMIPRSFISDRSERWNKSSTGLALDRLIKAFGDGGTIYASFLFVHVICFVYLFWQIWQRYQMFDALKYVLGPCF